MTGRRNTAAALFGRRDAGAALVETAIVTPLLLLILFGAIELGSAWQFATQLERAARAGARPATALSANAYADRDALAAVVGSISAADRRGITAVVVYDATDDPRVPDACLRGSVPGRCNSYTPQQFTAVAGQGRWGCRPGSLDASWCPTGRSSSSADPIKIGIHIAGYHRWVTGVLSGDGLGVSATVVMQLDPG